MTLPPRPVLIGRGRRHHSRMTVLPKLLVFILQLGRTRLARIAAITGLRYRQSRLAGHLRRRDSSRLAARKSDGRDLWFMVEHDGFGAVQPADAGVNRERLGNDLIHVVVAISGETTDEVNAFGLIGQLLILSIDFGVFSPRNGIVGVAFGLRELIDDAVLGCSCPVRCLNSVMRVNALSFG